MFKGIYDESTLRPISNDGHAPSPNDGQGISADAAKQGVGLEEVVVVVRVAMVVVGA